MALAQPSELKLRQLRCQRGREIAQVGARLLVENFGAKQVALFGSLLNPAQVRSLSDIDLAVWGLPDQDYYQAVSALASLSSDFTVDLVQVESAAPGLRRAIEQQGRVLNLDGANFQPPESTNGLSRREPEIANYGVLFGQIEHELEELEALAHKVEALLEKLRKTQDEDYLGTVALDIHSFYSGTERIFKQIAQTVDRSVPESADWYRQLLRQMAAPVWETRPAVLGAETIAMLEDYCSFRHVVRNIYSMNLKFDRVEALAAILPACLSLVRADLQSFIAAMWD